MAINHPLSTLEVSNIEQLSGGLRNSAGLVVQIIRKGRVLGLSSTSGNFQTAPQTCIQPLTRHLTKHPASTVDGIFGANSLSSVAYSGEIEEVEEHRSMWFGAEP